MIRRIDPLSRAAYGVLCVAAMSLLAIPVLGTVGVVGGAIIALDGNGDRALAVWLGSWAAAVFAFLLFFTMAYLFWPLASDWIIEWPGYVTALTIGACGLAFMAFLVFVTPWPLAMEVLVPLAVTFLTGFSIPGRFLGLRRQREPRREPARLARRR